MFANFSIYVYERYAKVKSKLKKDGKERERENEKQRTKEKYTFVWMDIKSFLCAASLHV